MNEKNTIFSHILKFGRHIEFLENSNGVF